MKTFVITLVASTFLASPTYAAALYVAELIFPLERWHNHASCIVECPNGDLLVCWYNGSGERNADDVKVLGARKRKGDTAWSKPFLLADTPGFPDTNPCLFVDPRQRLWLIWQTIIANQWHTALTKYKIASSYQEDGPLDGNTATRSFSNPGPSSHRPLPSNVTPMKPGWHNCPRNNASAYVPT